MLYIIIYVYNLILLFISHITQFSADSLAGTPEASSNVFLRFESTETPIELKVWGNLCQTEKQCRAWEYYAPGLDTEA